MLKESFTYLSNLFFCDPLVRELGLLSDLIAIKARHQRLKSSWQGHLHKCQNTIKNFCETITDKKSIVIFGAGLTKDLPLEYLVANFQEVILVDIVFLLETINSCKKYPNVKFIKNDLTGNLRETIDLLKSNKNLDSDTIVALTNLTKQNFELDPSLQNKATYISVNLLSQLPLNLKAYLQAKYPQVPEECYQAVFKNILESHLKLLQGLSKAGSEVLLITDYQKNFYARNNELLLSQSSIENISLEEFKQLDNWTWTFAPYDEIDKDFHLNLEVIAIPL